MEFKQGSVEEVGGGGGEGEGGERGEREGEIQYVPGWGGVKGGDHLEPQRGRDRDRERDKDGGRGGGRGTEMGGLLLLLK